MAENLEDLQYSQQLIVGGCVRALYAEDIVSALFNSFNGRKALSRAVKYECHEVLAVPQVGPCVPCVLPSAFAEWCRVAKWCT